MFSECKIKCRICSKYCVCTVNHRHISEIKTISFILKTLEFDLYHHCGNSKHDGHIWFLHWMDLDGREE